MTKTKGPASLSIANYCPCTVQVFFFKLCAVLSLCQAVGTELCAVFSSFVQCALCSRQCADFEVNQIPKQ